MSDSWFPLPFPRCSHCGNAWVATKHRGCNVGGDMEIEPWQQRVRCSACHANWFIQSSTFYCSCGNQFSATEARGAVDEVVRATRRLYEELTAKKEELRTLRQRNDASFSTWLGQAARAIGGAAGFVVGRLIRVLFG